MVSTPSSCPLGHECDDKPPKGSNSIQRGREIACRIHPNWVTFTIPNLVPVFLEIWYPFFSEFGTRFSQILVPVFPQNWYPFLLVFRGCPMYSENTQHNAGNGYQFCGKTGTRIGEKRVPKLEKNGYHFWRKTGTNFDPKWVPNSMKNGYQIGRQECIGGQTARAAIEGYKEQQNPPKRMRPC